MIRNQRLCVSAAGLLLLAIPIVGAGFFAPYRANTQNREVAFRPPTLIHWVDWRGHLHLRPFVCRWVDAGGSAGSEARYEDCGHTSSLRFFVREETVYGATMRSASWHLFGTDRREHIFLLGSDEYGRDQFSRLLYGGQKSVGAGLLATLLSLALGLLFGCIAGYFVRVDDVIMRMAELFMALPWIYLLFAVRAALPLRLDSRQAFLLLIGVIGLVGWARPARLIRGVILSAKQRNYVLAARGFGISDLTILRRHILPEVSSVVLTQAALLVPQCMLAEVTLSFLGLGVGEPQPSWGSMLANLESYYALTTHLWMLASALALLPLFFLLYWFADSLQQRFQVLERANSPFY